MSSIILTGVSWFRSDGTALFSNIDMTFGRERVGLVGRNGAGKSCLLRLMVGEMACSTGTVSRLARIGYLRQNLDVRPMDTVADLFAVRDQITVLRRAEAGLATADDLAVADWTLEDRMTRALARVGLGRAAPDMALKTLSGGQRTRAALAALFFKAPELLLLDEPTNHLDRQGRTQVIDALRGWQGGLIVASHDRTLLAGMDAIVEISDLGVKRYGGNYDAYRAQKDRELAAARHDFAQAERTLAETQRRAQEAAERKARTNRQGRAARASGSQAKIILDAAKQRSEKSGGAGARLRDRRTSTARDALDEASKQIEMLEPLRMDVPTVGLAPARNVLTIEGLSFGYDPDHPILNDVSLALRGPERVAIEGANGAGKSTLLSLVMGDLQPQSGTVVVHVPVARLDQDVKVLDPAQSVCENFARLDPDATENSRRAALARFGFRAEAADTLVGTLSGGQRLRAGLACLLGRRSPPQLLLLDEPSNHLDIEATETLEDALRGYDGAILVVSHDPVFINRIGVDRSIEL